MASLSHEENNNGLLTIGCWWFKSLPVKLWSKTAKFVQKAKKIGEDDPRKIIHCFKVGLSLTLVSLFYYFQPLYHHFGVNAIWAVLTVGFVIEFSVGATLGRGLNRMLATWAAGALGLGAHNLASLVEGEGEAVLLAIFVFVVAATVSFLRFIPEMQRRFDFGLLVFILTFCLVSISSYREQKILDLANDRLSTIIIGSTITMLVCTFVCPVWVGEDLHKLIALNVEQIGNFIEGFGDEYFKVSDDGQSNQDKSFLLTYKNVLNSGDTEQTMAALARWEPRHGRFRFRHPWKQYLKVGDLIRQCAYKIEALHSYLTSEIRTPLEIRVKMQEPFTKISTETGKALMELSSAIHKMERPTKVTIHIENIKVGTEELKNLFKTSLWEDFDLMEVIPVAAVSSLLLDVVLCTQRIAEAVQELADLARFKCTPGHSGLIHRGTIQPMRSIEV